MLGECLHSESAVTYSCCLILLLAETSSEEKATLASHLRLPHVQPLFLASVLPRMSWLLEVLTPGGLAMALGATRGVGDDSCCQLLQEAVPGMPRAWLQGPRSCPQR